MVRLDDLQVRIRIHGARRQFHQSQHQRHTGAEKLAPGTRGPACRLIDTRLLRRVEPVVPSTQATSPSQQARACAATVSGVVKSISTSAPASAASRSCVKLAAVRPR
jgi:hypothetical protein